MTAFARQETSGPWGLAVWEVRTINHRYFDMNVRLPDILGSLEPLLREMARKYIQRGKLECSLRYRPNLAAQANVQLNMALVEQLMKAGHDIAQHAHQTVTPMSISDILVWPGVIQTSEQDLAALQIPLMGLFAGALKDLCDMRQREGAGLKKTLEERLATMATIVQDTRTNLPELSKGQRDKIVSRFHELKIDVDPTRLEQELVLFAHRTDVAEELDRLEIHMAEVQRTLNQSGAQGRRLDFLMQELHREANTLGAKSVDSMELKVLIEQMREQVQNVE